MIFFFGTRSGKPRTQALHNVACPHCYQTHTLTAVARPNYAHLFWIPLFTVAAFRFVSCWPCKRLYYKEAFTPNMQHALCV